MHDGIVLCLQALHSSYVQAIRPCTYLYVITTLIRTYHPGVWNGYTVQDGIVSITSICRGQVLATTCPEGTYMH